MKRLITVCLTVMPLITMAQKVEVSAEGGAGTIFYKKLADDHAASHNYGIYSFGVKGAYNISRHCRQVWACRQALPKRGMRYPRNP